MSILVAMSLWVVMGAQVAAAIDVAVPTSSGFASTWDQAQFSHDLWGAFLSAHVDEAGLVDYFAARDDSRLREYLYRLAQTDVAALPDSSARKAFWINAYNALAILGVLETLPADADAARRYSVVEQPLKGLPPHKGFFAGLRFLVGGRRLTLDDIEKRILLRQTDGLGPGAAGADAALAPDRGDPRVHFALVCCARGCPRLARRPYVAERIDAQLDAAVRRFVGDPERSRFDVAARVWHVSELLDWYGADFTRSDYSPSAGDVLTFFAEYAPDEGVRGALSAGGWRMTYLKYDWRLNIQGE